MTQEFEIVEPDPSSLIEALRAFGYSPETSLADLIDNSITANAKNIWVKFVWAGAESHIEILDDGSGMDTKELVRAMKVGSQNPLNERDAKDLGRFGLGLKTASFAQCRHVSVSSLKDGLPISTRIWDLDYVAKHGQWRLMKYPSKNHDEIITGSLGKNMASGTLIIWSNLDRMLGLVDESDSRHQDNFYEIESRVAKHLSMVFHRYMEGNNKINIYIAGDPNPLKPWDPFLTDEDYTDPLPIEKPSLFDKKISVEPFVLPHHTMMSSKEAHNEASGIKGWNAHQGFYIYRNKRMLVPGSWLGIRNLKQEEHYKLARIKVDIPNSMDDSWELDVKKSEARPPSGLRSDLARIAGVVRGKARDVYAFRGKPSARKHAEDFEYIWNSKELRSRIRYSINRNHPLIKSVKSLLGKNIKALEATLKLIEETIPITQFWIDSSENPDKHIQHFEGKSESEVLEVMMETYNAMLNNGFTSTEALERLPNLELSARYPHILAILLEKVQQKDD